MLNKTQTAAAKMLGNYSTPEETASALNIPAETVRGWESDPEFSAEIASARDAAEIVLEKRVQAEALSAFGATAEEVR